jgi:hypothetical protein
MPQIGSGQAGAKEALTGCNRQTSKMLYLLRTQEMIVDQTGFGYLSWCEDDAQYLTVSGTGPWSGVNQQVDVSGSGFTPVTGQLVLLRNLSTGAGFVTAVEAYGGGKITVDCQRYSLVRSRTTNVPVLEDVSVSPGWVVVRVWYYYPLTVPLTSEDGPAPTQAEDAHSMGIQYQFVTESKVVYPAGLTFDFN